MSGRPLVIYHANCMDGWCAAWILHRSLGGVDLFAAYHGSPCPPVEGRTVIVVDFSYPRAVMEMMHSDCRSLLVLDHHKTAEADCEGLPYCIFDMSESGATLALKWCDQKGHLLGVEPKEVRSGMAVLAAYVKDRDLWLWHQENSKEINAALRSYPYDLDVWDHLARRMQVSPYSLAEEGRAISRYRQVMIDQHVKHARPISIDEYNVMGTECTASEIISDVAGTIAEDHDFGVTWFHDWEGAAVFSLRSRDGGIDVSEVAKRFGGGGHRNAAGFRCTSKMNGHFTAVVSESFVEGVPA